jgi:DNA polymerase III epsilon subunit-like protein
MSKLYPGMTHLSGNVLAAIDFETTGRRPAHHEIIQIAILPLNHDLQPHPEIPVFYMNIRPDHPERAERSAFVINGLDLDLLLLHAPAQEKVVDLLCEWFNKLDLPQNRVIVPLAHNWAFESAFLKGWLGPDLVDQMFHSHGRDSMLLAAAINDKAFFLGDEIQFPKLGLVALCEQLGIPYENAHDALADCRATAELYRRLLAHDI